VVFDPAGILLAVNFSFLRNPPPKKKFDGFRNVRNNQKCPTPLRGARGNEMTKTIGILSQNGTRIFKSEKADELQLREILHVRKTTLIGNFALKCVCIAHLETNKNAALKRGNVYPKANTKRAHGHFRRFQWGYRLWKIPLWLPKFPVCVP